MLMLPSLAHLTKLRRSSELTIAALDKQHERQKRPCAARCRVFAPQPIRCGDEMGGWRWVGSACGDEMGG